MLRASQIAGFIGVGLAGAAYIPQILHLVRVHCSAGISRFAFSLWLAATVLVTTNAVATGAIVFIVLGGVQLLATALILLYSTKYRSSYCASHVPVDLRVEAELALIDDPLHDDPARLAAASLGRVEVPRAKEVAMSEFTTVASSKDVVEGEMAMFEMGGQRIAVANVEGSFHAFGDICTHQQCSLAGGELEGKTVTCPCHGSQFDVTTGAVLNPPATERVPVFPLRVEDDEIKVKT